MTRLRLRFPALPQQTGRRRAAGQSIVEYAGMIVISTLMVGGMMSGTQRVMPVLFSLLSQRNAMALSEAPPLPAADFPSPAPEGGSEIRPSRPEAHSRTTGIPGLARAIPGPAMKWQASPSLAMTQTPNGLNTIDNNQPNPASVANQAASPVPGPMPAPPPNIFSGPSPAPPPQLAPGPAPAPAPQIAPVLIPVAPP